VRETICSDYMAGRLEQHAAKQTHS